MHSMMRHFFIKARFLRHPIYCLSYQTVVRSYASRVGFIGLGRMGANMAGRLAMQGHRPIVFDQSQEALQNFMEAHAAPDPLTPYNISDDGEALTSDPEQSHRATAARSVAEVGAHSDTVFTMLPSGEDVKNVYFGTNGLLNNTFLEKQNHRLVLVDCSSIGLKLTKEIHDEVKQLGHSSVDAPVTGGVSGASRGTLTFMCGGIYDDVERIRPFLSLMGRIAYYCGESGSGQLMKICNNVVLATSMVGMSEALRLAESGGLDMKLVNDILHVGTARSWLTSLYCPVPGVLPSSPATNEYTPGFKTNLIHADLKSALEIAKNYHIEFPLMKLATSMYYQLIENGYGEKDFSVIYHDLLQVIQQISKNH